MEEITENGKYDSFDISSKNRNEMINNYENNYYGGANNTAISSKNDFTGDEYAVNFREDRLEVEEPYDKWASKINNVVDRKPRIDVWWSKRKN